MKHYQLHEDPQGCYCRADGTRCELRCVKNIRTPQGYNVGWTPFETLAACLAAWGLVYAPLPAPQAPAASDIP